MQDFLGRSLREEPAAGHEADGSLRAIAAADWLHQSHHFSSHAKREDSIDLRFCQGKTRSNMTQSLSFLSEHGPVLLFFVVLAELLGLPLPAVPVLVAMGAMAGEGRFSFTTGLLIAVSAWLIADVVWYRLGRWRGARVLNFLCRISLEPDSCVRSAENVLAARGPRALLFAKFFPGLSTVATP